MSICDDAVSIRLEAANLIQKVISEQPKRLAELLAKHEEDKKLYQFRCERHGDFLAVFITRAPQPDGHSIWGRTSNKVVSAINLNAHGTITLNEGSAPACDETASLTFSFEHPKTSEGATDYSAARIRKVVPSFSDCDAPYPVMLRENEKSARNGMMFGSQGRYKGEEYLAGIVIPGIARGARDDKIYFSAAGVTVHAPAGIGASVYKKILAANSKAAP